MFEALLALAVIALLKGSSSSSDGKGAPPPPKPPPAQRDTTAQDIANGVNTGVSIAAALTPVVVAIVKTIAGETTGVVAGEAGGDVGGEVGSEVSAEVSAEVAGEGSSVAGAVAVGLVIAVMIAIFLTEVLVMGPALVKIADEERRRRYGKPGVLVRLSSQCFAEEQSTVENTLYALIDQLKTLPLPEFTRVFGFDPATPLDTPDYYDTDQHSYIDTVSNLSAPHQAVLAQLGRVMAVETLRAANNTLFSWYLLRGGHQPAEIASEGIALSAADFDLWADAYVAGHQVTSWGLADAFSTRVGGGSRLGNALRRPMSYSELRSSVIAVGGADFEKAIAGAVFKGKVAALNTACSEDSGIGWPGEDQFVTNILVFCQLGWRKVGLWLVDDASGNAINPSQTRFFQRPYVTPSRYITPLGQLIAGGPPP